MKVLTQLTFSINLSFRQQWTNDNWTEKKIVVPPVASFDDIIRHSVNVVWNYSCAAYSSRSRFISRSIIRNFFCRVAKPLLCETKSWVTGSRLVNSVESSSSPQVLVPWPRLKCCDSHDYCNADDGVEGNTSTWTRERKSQMDQASSTVDRETPGNPASTSRDATQIQPDRKSEVESADRLLQNRVRALHVAALILAFAALISVLASYYVVTR